MWPKTNCICSMCAIRRYLGITDDSPLHRMMHNVMQELGNEQPIFPPIDERPATTSQEPKFPAYDPRYLDEWIRTWGKEDLSFPNHPNCRSMLYPVFHDPLDDDEEDDDDNFSPLAPAIDAELSRQRDDQLAVEFLIYDSFREGGAQ